MVSNRLNRPFGFRVCVAVTMSCLITAAPIQAGPAGSDGSRGGNGSVPRGNNVELIDQIGGLCSAVAYQNNYAFIGEGSSLIVLNVSNPASPTRTARLRLGGFVQDISVSGTRAYVAAREAGAYILDLGSVSNPLPTIVGRCDTPGMAWAVKELGGRLYIADHSGGLRVWDILTNPASPQELGFLVLPANALALDVKPQNDSLFAYVAADTAGLHVIDVGVPATPMPRGTHPTARNSRNVVVVNNYAYVANGMPNNGEQGLQIINVSNPDSPTLAGQHNAWVNDVAVQSGRAYLVGTSGNRVMVLDVNNPSSPSQLGTSSIDGSFQRIVVSSGRAYVANNEDGMAILNVSTPSAITQLGTSNSAPGSSRTGFGSTVAAAGGLVYVGTQNRGITVLDVAAPLSPLRGSYDGSAGVLHVAVDANTAYVNENANGRVRILNVTNPSSIGFLSLYEPGTMLFIALAQSGSNLYLGGSQISPSQQVLHVLSVSNPSSPAPRGTVNLDLGSRIPTAIAKLGNYAYVVAGELRVVDVSNSSSPMLRGRLTMSGDATGVAALGTEAYVAAGDGGIHVVNVSNPDQPVINRSFDTAGLANGVALGRGLVFVADGSAGGLQVLDASVPGQQPVVVASYDTPGSARRVAYSADNDLIYVADGSCGVAVLRLLDYTPPTITITTPVISPTYSTATSPIPLGGAAQDDVAVTQVTWANDRGGNGIAGGTDSWFVPSVALQSGINVITVTAYDAAGNSGSDTLTVTFTPPDNQRPVVQIMTPTDKDAYVTIAATVDLSGSASDNVGVTEVTWQNNLGGNGTANGTTAWNIDDVALQLGSNTITVTARDAAGNTGTGTLTVHRCPGLPTGDMNADGMLNGDDIPPFITAILRVSTDYNDICRGDFSGDIRLDPGDLPHVIAALLIQ